MTIDNPIQIDVYDKGSGPALVLLHGMGGTWHIWKPVIALLGTRYRIIAPTLPGHCNGPALPAQSEATVANMAEALIAMLRARGVESAHVVGNSLGGWLALELARRGFARSVLALSPAGAWNTPKDYRKIALRFRIVFFLLPLLIALTTMFLGSAWLRKILGGHSMERGDLVPEGEFRQMLQGMNKATILPELLKTMGRDGPIAPMTAGAVPVCIAWGELDQVIPFEQYGRPMLERVNGAERVTVPGVGHVPMYDDPQAVCAAILGVTSPLDDGQTGERL
jgi:pimeloyl-ACP methyl ester carboxylesterase